MSNFCINRPTTPFRELHILTLPSKYILENILHVNKKKTTSVCIVKFTNTTSGTNNFVPASLRSIRCRDGVGYLAIKFYNNLPTLIRDLLEIGLKIRKELLVQFFLYYLDEFLNDKFQRGFSRHFRDCIYIN